MYERALILLREVQRMLLDTDMPRNAPFLPKDAPVTRIAHILQEGETLRRHLHEDMLRLELAQHMQATDVAVHSAHDFRHSLLHELTAALSHARMLRALLDARKSLICAQQESHNAHEPQPALAAAAQQARTLLTSYCDVYASQTPPPACAACRDAIEAALTAVPPLPSPVGENACVHITPPALAADVTPFVLTGVGHGVEHWIAAALNAHPRMLAVPGYEALRAGYATPVEEWNWLASLPHFLQNLGRPAKAAGDCHSCTPRQAATMLRIHGPSVRAALLLCHPYNWLEQRLAGRLRTLAHVLPLLQELAQWRDFFGLYCLSVETLLRDPQALQALALHLSAGQCAFLPDELRAIYATVPPCPPSPHEVWASWPRWMRRAFTLFIPEETMEAYHQHGYALASSRAPAQSTHGQGEAPRMLRPEDVCLELASVAPPLPAHLNIEALSLPTALYLHTVSARTVREVLASIDDAATLCIVADGPMVLHMLEEARTRSGPLLYVDTMQDDVLPLRLSFICPHAKALALDELPSHMPDVILAAGPQTMQKIRAMTDTLTCPCIDFSELNLARCRQTSEYILQQIVADIRALNPDILYVGKYIYFNMVRQSMALRRRGLKTAILILESSNLQHKQGHFDGVFTAWRDMTLLFAILRAVDAPRIVHVQGWMTQHYLSVLVKAASPRSTVVCEFNDIASYFAPWEDYERIWGAQSRTLEQYSEKAVHHLLDGLIYNHAEPYARAKQQEYGGAKPFTVFHSYPTPQLCAPPPEVKAQADAPSPEDAGPQPLRLAFIGTLAPSFLPHEYWGDIKLLPVFQQLVEHALAVDVFTLPFQDATEGNFADYQYLQKTRPNFTLRGGLPPDKLAAALVDYDFGIMFYDFTDVKVLPSHLAGIMPSKFYSYLEACLPVIVSEELAYVAAEVRAHGLGLVVSQDEVHNPAQMAQRLAAADGQAMRRAIVTYRKAHSMDKEIERLLAFYDNLRRESKALPDMLEPARRRLALALEQGTPLVVAPYLPEEIMRKYLARMGLNHPEKAPIQCIFDNMTEYHSLTLFRKYSVRPRNAHNMAALPPETLFVVMPCFGYPNIVASLRQEFHIPEDRIIHLACEE